MAAVISTALPSLSQIYGWDTEHLSRAATDWSTTAERWEDAFDTVRRGTLAPGATAWEGVAADAAQERSFGDLVRVRGLADVLSDAATTARRGAVQLDSLKRQAIEVVEKARDAGFTVADDLTVTDTSKYRGSRVVAVQQFAATIAARAAALSTAEKDIATKITTATTELNGRGFSEPPESVHAMDVPLAPPPDPSYPVNDVIAEATDLDGNHVVLRRGYYNAATKDGFGWDKVYWKHGLINPNVFKDLISHAHPEENQGGTLVYEVPINKAHCTSGFLGLPSCTDTGESLTMRIVANTNPSYDVPGGGQKGVITMYPLPGGSGVVEVEKNWTLTPPWVNRYAPIN